MNFIPLVASLSLLLGIFVSAGVAATTTIPPRWSEIGVNVDPTNAGGNASVAQLTQLGTGWARVEYKPNSKGGSVSLYDAVVAEYTKAGFRVLLILDYTSVAGVPWGQTSPAAWQGYINQFAALAGQVARRYSSYGTSISYEIWNEPDLKATAVPPAVYATLLCKAHGAIQAVSKSAVVLGGLASGNPGWVTEVERASPGSQLCCDSVGLHPYGQRPAANWPSSSWGFGTIQQLVANYRSVTHHKLVITEVGTADMSVQGEFPSRMFAATNSLGIDMTIWFCWSDSMVKPFGLLNSIGQQKPSYSNYKMYSHH